MRMHAAAMLTAGCLLPLVAMATEGALCSAHSGPRTAALVELYTSEGCSSCPPADRTLGHLRQVLGADADGVGLALHVNYWDYIGWRDPWAQEIFSERHQWLVHANHHDVVYTPHFFVNGVELSSGQTRLREQVREINSRPAQASIALSARHPTPGLFTVEAAVQTSERVGPAALYVALAQSGLSSNVLRGENAGRTLTHDHVVRVWIGPLALSNGQARVHRDLVVPDGAPDAQWELAAFVQEQQTGKVVQALELAPCPQSSGAPTQP